MREKQFWCTHQVQLVPLTTARFLIANGFNMTCVSQSIVHGQSTINRSWQQRIFASDLSSKSALHVQSLPPSSATLELSKGSLTAPSGRSNGPSPARKLRPFKRHNIQTGGQISGIPAPYRQFSRIIRICLCVTAEVTLGAKKL